MAQRDGHYEIVIADAGPGIPPEARERVFERFFRVDAARSRSESSVTSGAGLGLAIARRIAEMHAGRLELAESRPGRTEFRLTLPAAVTSTEASRPL
jgi:signal transduction histidine kinase